jgi:tRNA1(Val) A37 N6-methylase TrmN6
MWYVACGCDSNTNDLSQFTAPLAYAGAGNAIFPLLSQNRNPELRIHAFDYSSHAVKLVQVTLNLCCVSLPIH